MKHKERMRFAISTKHSVKGFLYKKLNRTAKPRREQGEAVYRPSSTASLSDIDPVLYNGGKHQKNTVG